MNILSLHCIVTVFEQAFCLRGRHDCLPHRGERYHRYARKESKGTIPGSQGSFDLLTHAFMATAVHLA